MGPRGLRACSIALLVATGLAGCRTRPYDPSETIGPPEARGPGPAVWHWVNPLPQGNQLNGVWASSATDAWAVGAWVILHFDGATWSVVPGVPPGPLGGVWGSGPDDVWAVGGQLDAGGEISQKGAILHFDGATWSKAFETEAPAVSIGGTARDDVFVGTYGRGLLHFDGRNWSPVEAPINGRVSSISARTRNDVWAVSNWFAADSRGEGTGGDVMHFDGSGWAPLRPTDRLYPLRILSIGANDVWMLTDRALFHDDGRAWTPLFNLEGGTALAGTAADDVWLFHNDLAPSHFDGAKWSPHEADPAGTLRGVEAGWSVNPQTAFAVGRAGLVARWNGGHWQIDSRNLPDLRGAEPDLNGIAGAPDDLFVAGMNNADGSSATLHFDGQRWMRFPSHPRQWIRHLWSRRGATYAVGDDYSSDVRDAGLWRWNGNDWSLVPLPGEKIRAVGGTGPDDVWVMTSGKSWGMLHFDGAAWTPFPVAATWNAVALQAFTRSDAWFVTEFGGIYHFDGTGWSFAHQCGGAANGLWGSSPHDVWVLAASPRRLFVCRWNGSDWYEQDVPGGGGDFLGSWLSGSAPDDVYLNNGWRYFHWDGTAWTIEPIPAQWVTRIRAFGPRDAWAVGWGGAILHKY